MSRRIEELTSIGFAALDDEPWEYYDVGVWQDEEGYYLATDAGCSCPIPFENYAFVDELTGPLTAEQAREEVMNLYRGSGKEGNTYVEKSVFALIERIV